MLKDGANSLITGSDFISFIEETGIALTLGEEDDTTELEAGH